MALIKANNAPTGLQPFSMRDIEQQAAGMLLRAKEHADRLLTETQREAEIIREEARIAGSDQGRREGLAKGIEEGRKAGHQQALNENRQAITDALQALAKVMTEIDASRGDLQAHTVRQVIELAVAIARRVTKIQGITMPEVLTENIHEAMKLVVQACDLRIAIHPNQKATLEDALPRLKLNWPQLEHVEIMEDPALTPGGCRIHTRQGLIDADLDEQLDRVVSDLLPSAAEAIA